MERETLLFLIALATTAVACTARPTPCASADVCAGGEVCEVSRCARPSVLPASSASHRNVVAPSDVKMGDDGQSELRAGSSSGGQLMLVRFDVALRALRVESAFLVLSPAPTSPPASEPIDLVVSRVLEPWSGADPAWPRIGPTEARAHLTFAPPAPARIDVTSIVRDWARTGQTPQGFAIRTSGGEGIGARFAPGLGAARLDIYTR